MVDNEFSPSKSNKKDINIWAGKPLIFTASTFGSSSKAPILEYSDERYAVEKLSKTWVGYDSNGCSHSRLRVASTLGKMTLNPPPIQYNPDHEKQSRREVGPKLTIAKKFKDPYDAIAEDHKNSGAQYIPKYSQIPSIHRIKAPPMDKKHSDFAQFNLEDMRNALLPGPGSYDSNQDKIVKFVRPPQAFLAPRKRVAQSRSVLHFETLEVLSGDRARADCTGSYDIGKDPRKKRVAHTIGERRILRNQAETLSVGPGYYNVSKVLTIGRPTMISSQHTALSDRKDYA